jgi:hypothetical protein
MQDTQYRQKRFMRTLYHRKHSVQDAGWSQLQVSLWLLLLLLVGAANPSLARPESYKSTFNKSWWVFQVYMQLVLA